MGALCISLQRVLTSLYTVQPGKGAVLITGGRSGIGRFCAEMLAKKGWTVFVTVRKAADAEAISSEGPLVPLVLDVTNDDHFAPALQQLEVALNKRSLKLAAVVANAGINPEGDAYSDAEEKGEVLKELAPISVARSVFDTNFMGVARTATTFLPRLREDRGRFIMIGSYFGTIAGALGLPHLYYESTKFALEGYADGLRRALKSEGVMVSMVKPGNIVTGMNDKHGEDNPKVVADAVNDAISASHPRARYYAGRVKSVPMWLICRIFSLLPEALTDCLL